jgi:uncharacterized membrane protein YdbT with pleckstrin-like domain
MLNTYHKADLARQLNVSFEEDERILWSGRPRLKVFLLNSCLKIFSSLLFLLGTFAVIFLLSANDKDSKPDPLSFLGFFSIVLLFETIRVISEAVRLRKTTYIITQYSVIIFTDSGGSSTKNIYVRDIQTKDLKRTFIDKRFQTASIALFTGEMKNNDGADEKVYDMMHAITDAENAFRHV